MVEAYDVRPAVKDQVVSVGAKFVEFDLETADAEDKGGYAKAQSDDFIRRQQDRFELLYVGLVLRPPCQALQMNQIGNRRDSYGRFQELELLGAGPQLLERHRMINEQVDHSHRVRGIVHREDLHPPVANPLLAN